MNEIFERLLPRNITNCVCEYDGVIHEWAYIRMGLYLECFKCQYYGGLVHGGQKWGGGAGLIVGGLRYFFTDL